MGELEKMNLLEIPLNSCFENLKIEVDYSNISFERKWMNAYLL